MIYPKGTRASPLRQPEYPPEARARGDQGVVAVDVLIDVDGRVKDAKVAMSGGHASMDASTLKEVRTWRFTPGQINGKPAAFWSIFFITFALPGGGPLPDQRLAIAEVQRQIEQRNAELEAQAAQAATTP